MMAAPTRFDQEVLFCHWHSHDTWVHRSPLFESSIWGANSLSTIYSRSLQKYTMLLSLYRCLANRELSGYTGFLYIFAKVSTWGCLHGFVTLLPEFWGYKPTKGLNSYVHFSSLCDRPKMNNIVHLQNHRTFKWERLLQIVEVKSWPNWRWLQAGFDGTLCHHSSQVDISSAHSDSLPSAFYRAWFTPV